MLSTLLILAESVIVEGNFNILGGGLAAGFSGSTREELYLAKVTFDSYVQGYLASAGLRYRNNWFGNTYLEPGVGWYRLGLDEVRSDDDRGFYLATAVGTYFLRREYFHLGVEWATVYVLNETWPDRKTRAGASLPKFAFSLWF